MKSRITTACMLLAMAWTGVGYAQAQVDLSVLDRDMAGSRAQVLVLGSVHLSQLPDSFKAESLQPVIDRLLAFKPDVVTIEAIAGEQCDLARRHPAVYGDEGLRQLLLRSRQRARHHRAGCAGGTCPGTQVARGLAGTADARAAAAFGGRVPGRQRRRLGVGAVAAIGTERAKCRRFHRCRAGGATRPDGVAQERELPDCRARCRATGPATRACNRRSHRRQHRYSRRGIRRFRQGRAGRLGQWSCAG